jgi:acetyltransferase-like isoleucine patch superfamily enzyme
MTLQYLWRHRSKAPILSKAWVKISAKRIANAPDLLLSLWRAQRLRSHGAKIEMPVFFSPGKWIGPKRNLHVAKGTFIGRVEVHLHECVSIGQRVIISDGVRLLTGTHDVQDMDFALRKQSIRIGDYAWIGTSALVLPGVKIGTGAVVGAGSVVTRDIPDHGIAVGNPARCTGKSRNPNLRYEPLRMVPCFEAWLGTKATDALPHSIKTPFPILEEGA